MKWTAPLISMNRGCLRYLLITLELVRMEAPSLVDKITLPEQAGRTIFGKVTAGLDVLNSLTIRDNIFNPALDKVLGVAITEK